LQSQICPAILIRQDIQSSSRVMGLTFLNKIMATETNLQSYELMLIFTPVLADEDYKNAQKKFSDFIKENGGFGHDLTKTDIGVFEAFD